MAEAAAAAEVIQEKDICSVCRDPTTKGPRVLDCGHHFCLSCLDKLVVEKTITCPNCRYITQVNTGVEGLAWYRTTNPFTDQVTQASTQTKNTKIMGEIICDFCVAKNTHATKICTECSCNFCDECSKKHEKLEDSLSHEICGINSYTICEHHENRVVRFACLTCNMLCCTHCVMGDHNSHKLKKICRAGKESRDRLHSLKNELVNAEDDKNINTNIENILGKAKDVRNTFQASIKGIKSALTDLAAKVDKVSEEVNTKMAATIKTLEMMSSDIGDYMTSKASLRELFTYLIEGASSPEVMIREKELPKYDKSTYKQVIREPEVEIAELGDNLNEIKDKLDKCQQDLDISFIKHSVCGPQYDTTPLSNLQRAATIHAGNNTWGLAVDSSRQRLVVRRKDATAPISVYDFQGQRLQVLGQGVEGITHADYQGVAIDTMRDLYILPVNDGSLVTMDTDGNVKDKIMVTDSDCLHGVAYTEDFYITCRNSGEVHLVNPENNQKVAKFSPNTTFSAPYNVSSGLCSITGEPELVFIISYYYSHCIKLVDSSGRLLHTYGKEGMSGQGEGELFHPWGVCTDPGGRIIVCDQSNQRVVAFWRADGKDRWETLLDKDKLGGKVNSWHVTCDPVSRRLFVGYNDGTIYIDQ